MGVERMVRVGVGTLCFLQCYNTVGWMTGRTSSPLSPKIFPEQVEESDEGKTRVGPWTVSKWVSK